MVVNVNYNVNQKIACVKKMELYVLQLVYVQIVKIISSTLKYN